MSWYRAEVCEPAAVQAFLDHVERGAQRADRDGVMIEGAQVLAEQARYGLVFYFNELARASILFLRFTASEACEPPRSEGLEALL
ncbi:hypothetical protein [Pseudomarimonas salicorniae]|uniref:Uncharacterized protein n=1 Tax=Pseudomarimonas salicorniae TaxID=2933270 RepID=A0ABT0GK46_9GAMM|nr:hypothetical protein [Lysobacter sp. CAU 1642]MCK7594903.1 hypothetical protein [Lysobacter sp. CAU 1642]